MENYLGLIKDILVYGEQRADRTGVGTRGIFGAMLRWDLRKGFPLVTSKYTWFKGVKHELLWMLSGDTNAKTLQKDGVGIWDEWALTAAAAEEAAEDMEEGYLGPVYGAMMRNYPTIGPDGKKVIIDQMSCVVSDIIHYPFSRRHIVNLWHPGLAPDNRLTVEQNILAGRQALAPCHYDLQFYVSADGKGLNLKYGMRSNDVFLGLPFNIAGYALLLAMVAKECRLEARELVYMGTDVHLYNNQLDLAEELLKRPVYELPKLVLEGEDGKSIFSYTANEIYLEEGSYRYGPAMKCSVAV